MSEALDYLAGGLLQGCIFALVALGFALVFRVAGAVNLAQGAFVVLGALTLYTFWQTLHWPLLGAFVAGVAVALVVGAVVARFIFEPGLRRLPGSGMVMLTAGLLVLFEGIFLLVWGSQPYQLPAFGSAAPLVLGSVHVSTQALWVLLATALIVLALWYVLQKTTLGRALRACAENPAAASLMGIDVRAMTVAAYAVAAAIGAIGGMVFGPIVSLQFDAGRFFTISGFIAVAIGGVGSFLGAVAGGFGLGVVQQFAAGYVSSVFASTFALVLLLAVLIFRPAGLFGGRSGRREDVRDAAVHGARPLLRLDPRVGRTTAALAVVALALFPLIPGTSGILSSLVITGILFIAILGLDVLMGFAGQVSLGHAAFVAIGGYAAAICTTRWAMAPLFAIVAGLAVSLACGAVLSLVTVRLRGLYMALATLAFGLLVDSLAVGLGNLTGGPSGFTGIPHLSLGAFSFDSQVSNYELILVLATLAVVVLSNLLRSDFGRALRAIRTDQTAARALGIDVARYKLYAFMISAGFASVAGSLYAFYFQFLSPEMVSTPRSIDFVTMLVVGGEGTLVGPLLGAALLTMLPTVFQPLANYKTLASGAILVGALLFAPGGLLGVAVALIDRLRPRTPRTARLESAA